MTCLTALAGEKLTIHLIGDSTCAPCDGSSPQRGWGQMLKNYFDTDRVTVRNWAKSGTSSKSYKNDGHWAKAKSNIKEGDYVLIQFGINDGSEDRPERYTKLREFADSLKSYVREVRSLGAIPVLASPIAKRSYIKGTYIPAPNRVARTYQMQIVALQKDVPYIDAHSHTADWIKSLGEEKSKSIFCHYGPNNYRSERFRNGRKDNTHLNEAGAEYVAKFFAKELKRLFPALK